MPKNIVNIQHLAQLSSLTLTEEQIRVLGPQLVSTIDGVAILDELNTSEVLPTNQVTGLTNQWRQDEVDTGRVFSQAEALANAKKTYNGYFVVPAVIDENV